MIEKLTCRTNYQNKNSKNIDKVALHFFLADVSGFFHYVRDIFDVHGVTTIKEESEVLGPRQSFSINGKK